MPPLAKLIDHPKSDVDNSSTVLALNTLARFDLDGMHSCFTICEGTATDNNLTVNYRKQFDTIC